MTKKKSNELALGLEALRLAARGLTNPQIAAVLHLNVDTIKGRLHKLYVLIGARNAAHAVVIASVERLLTVEDVRAAVADRRVGWRAPEEEEGDVT